MIKMIKTNKKFKLINNDNKKLIVLKNHIEYYELRRKELMYKNKELECEIDEINKKLQSLWLKFRTAYKNQMSDKKEII